MEISTSLQPSFTFLSNRLRNRLILLCVVGISIFSFNIGNFLFYKPFTILNNTIINSKLDNFVLNTIIDPTLPTLCVATRIYQAQLSYFSVFALALYHTGLHNVRIYLINTDNQTNIQQLEETVQFINQLVLCKDFVVLLDLGEPSNGKDFGYPMTDRVLAYLYRQHVNSSSICQYVTFTNADNFYSRNFAKKTLPHMKAGKDIIAWGFVSHHFKTQYRELIDAKIKTVPEIVDDGTQKCTPVKLIPGYVDLGAVAYRLSFLQKHNLYFRHANERYYFVSDGYFAEAAARRTNSSIILRQTLFMHQ